MKLRSGKFLALLLVIAMLLQLLPVTASAQEVAKAEHLFNSNDADVIGLAEDSLQTSADDLKNAKILFEEEELREENVKHFRLDNGSYIAVQYGTPVHYEENGQWLDYDNTLHEVSTFDGEGISHYTVTNGDSTRVFAADANADVLLALQTGDYSLTLTPVDEPSAEIPVTPIPPVEMEIMSGGMEAEGELQAVQNSGVSAELLQPTQPVDILCYSGSGEIEPYTLSTEEMSLFAQAQPEAMYSALEYVEALNGATLRYENYGNTVKESIVIEAPQETYSYTFALETEGLTPTLLEDGSIILSASDGAIIYTIPTPYMIDANKDISYDAAYTLSGSNGEYTLTVTADEDWINAPERAFPVLLDPTFKEDSDENDLAACFVRSGYPNTQDTTYPVLYAGYYNNSNQMTRSYFHLNNLPAIPGGCEVNSAYLQLSYYAIDPDSSASSVDLGIYELTYAGNLDGTSGENAWNQWIHTLTWEKVENGSAKHSDVLVDKVTLDWYDTYSDPKPKWDITTMAYEWYSSENHKKNMGFVLKAVDEENTFSRAAFYGPNSDTNCPVIFVSYRNTVGIESYYNYQTFGHGRAGVSYISDYSMQNTLVVPLIQSSSEVMPFSLNLVYNSAYGGRYFTEDSEFDNEVQMLHTKDYSDMLMYVGWKLSAQQTVVPFTMGDKNYLIYTDGDGTEHYFADDDEDGISEATDHDGIYEDEDGLKYKITISGTNYTMTNRTDYKWHFTNGFLTREEDAYGNRIDYHYAEDSSKLLRITRTNVGCTTEETLVTLSYGWEGVDLNQFPSSFTDQYGRTTSIMYSSPNSSIYYLRRIIFPDGQYADYIYTNQTDGEMLGYRLTRVYDAESQYGMEFSYSYNGDVRNLYEYVSSSKVYGIMIHGYKRSPSQTVYRYYGKDQTADAPGLSGGDDQLMFCVLDRKGKTVGCYVTDSSEKHVLGVSAAEFTENSGTDKRNNSITAAASAGLQGINLLQNSSGEIGTTGWSNCTVNFDPSYVYIGQKSLKFTDKTLLQYVDLQAGETYTFSGYVKKVGDARARLCIRLSGSEKATSELLNYDTSGVNNGWVRLSATYTPEQSGRYQAAVIVNGTAFADALQFEKGEGASSYNPVNDGSFEWTTEWEAVGSTGNGWRKNGNATIITIDPREEDPEVTGYFGSDVVKLTGGNGLHRVYQTVRLNQPLDSSFLLSAWAKGQADPNSVAEKTAEDDPYFGVAIHLYFSNGDEEIHYKSFDPYCHDWQYVQDIISPNKEGKDPTVTITHAIIAVAYDNNINAAYVDNVSLRLAQAQTYAYDAEGNVDTAALTGGGAEGAEYDADTGDLTKYTSPNGVVFNYTSNAQHSITKEVGAGTITEYTYDGNEETNSSGYLTSTKVTSSNGSDSRYLQTSYQSTADRNFTASVTDSAGNTVSYAYHKGLLAQAINPKGQTTAYLYDQRNGRPKSTYITGIAAINYTYAKGQLSQLQRKTFPYVGAPQEQAVYQTYNFAYNAWGQRTAVSVGDQTLATYTYEDINDGAVGAGGGNNTQTTYSNGDSVSYVYDAFDRLIKTVYNDSGEYVEYTYNGEGALSKLVHCSNNGTVIASYEFERDNLGRLIRSRQVNGSNATVQRTEHIYDAIGRISEQRWSVGSTNYSESYTYNDGATGNGALNTVTLGTGDQVVFTYDPLNRLTEELVKSPDGTTLFKHAIAYKNRENNQTTNLVQFYNVRRADGSLIAGNRYSYDNMGNITAIKQSTGSYFPLVSYDYDDQGQLISEKFYDGNGNGESHITDSYTYTYDTAGNILSVEDKYGETIKSYTYSTGDWKDLLTAVDGSPIVYEGQTYSGGIVSGTAISGNPIRYTNGTQTYTNLTWQHGRQLTNLTTNGETYTYDYDVDGIRTRKIIDGAYHNYVTQNGKVVRETVQSGDWDWVLDFIYDNAGRPFALKYSYDGGNNFETYYYILNYQGDVVALMDTSGTVIARYTYNAWGEPMSVTNNAGTAITDTLDIAHLNPLRYRGYYYDTETGFYYLKSRYYDPEICRFINADCYTSTGQGFIGFNMFAYCGSQPVSNTDETGTYYTSGQIHDFVLDHICEEDKSIVYKGTYMRYGKPYKNHTYGFCDLYRPSTGEVWEVKRLSSAYSCSYAYAKRQLLNYITNGTFKYHPKQELKMGSTIPTDVFEVPDNDGEGKYVITYWSLGDGIINYDYYYVPSIDEITEAAMVVATVGIYAAAVYCAVVLVSPVLVACVV